MISNFSFHWFQKQDCLYLTSKTKNSKSRETNISAFRLSMFSELWFAIEAEIKYLYGEERGAEPRQGGAQRSTFFFSAQLSLFSCGNKRKY